MLSEALANAHAREELAASRARLVEAGDAELRAGLAEVRELLAEVPAAVREFLRTFGR